MKLKKLLSALFASGVLAMGTLFGAENVENLPLIPAPRKIAAVPAQSPLKISSLTTICADANSADAAEFLQKLYKKRFKRSLPIVKSTGGAAAPGSVTITAGRKENSEAYMLSVTSNSVSIKGESAAGAFYGVCTLDQLFVDGNGANAKTIPALKISDAPRFAYRGLMIDPARNFILLEDVKKFVETMARYKFNVLHFHISDDQGWRVELKNPKYKKLMTVGAQQNKPKGSTGFYTQKEIKELVAFAKSLNVEVVPEIDMPGHSMAAIVPYPELTCEYIRRINEPKNAEELAQNKKMELKIWTTEGVSEALLCAGNPKTYEFYDGVLKEMCALFPSKMFHIGGDEAPTKAWERCKTCQDFMKKKNMSSTSELMSYFFQRNFEQLGKAGKTALYWFELDVPKYPKNAIMYAWRYGLTQQAINRAIREGYKVIICAGEYAYLDYPQKPGDPNHGWMPMTTLEQSYKLDPGYNRPASEQKSIIGCEGTLWGEYIQTLDRRYYQAFPRACAVAEAGWSQMERRDWESFKTRLKPLLIDMENRGIKAYWPEEIYGEKK
ncbi:MAG: beta-N-acetylhexosaminidase [Opitutae bacterium]|nr:beta-N-acetylhexosaminidase [Opitutae bacterium]MCD8299480.1 beta-N-acetylhexosaminidase [Opitutae bacterium]